MVFNYLFIAIGPQDDLSWAELRIVIIWRRDETRVRHEWLPEPWPEEDVDVTGGEGIVEGGSDSRLNRTQRNLADTLRRLLRPSEPLSYETVVKVAAPTLDTVDYYNHNFFYRFVFVRNWWTNTPEVCGVEYSKC